MTNQLLKSFLILPLIVFTSCLSDASKKNNQESADRNNGVTTLYLIRHAEKESGADPGLTRAGQARANAWVERFCISAVAGFRRLLFITEGAILKTIAVQVFT